MTELPATLTGLQAALAGRQLSVSEALASQRRRLERLDPALHCVVERAPDAASDAAVGALAGIGLAHKDIFDTAGRRPGLGHDAGHPAPGRPAATAVARLAAQGAAQLASLVMAEYACGATGENPHFERCVNPLRPEAAVGGSSSGSAVAVAGELAYGSLGTDTAGSVRMPAATCALVGLKTTHGLVPREGVHPLAPSLDSVGILARSAEDALALLEAVAEPGRLAGAGRWPCRIVAWLPEAGLHPEVAAALERFARDWGVTHRIVDWPGHETTTRLAETVLHAEAADTHRAALLGRTASRGVEAVALAGLAIPPEWHAAALRDRARQVRAFVDTHLRAHDLLLLPALPRPVPDWAAVTVDSAQFVPAELLALHRYMGFVNYLGLPALVMPVARDARGMPISVQLLARPFHERLLLRFAQAEQLRSFGRDGFTRAYLSTGSIH